MGGQLLGGRRIKYPEVHGIVRDYVSRYENHIHKYLTCGSYRRGKPDSGDIDLVIFILKDKAYSFDMMMLENHDVPWAHKKKNILWDGVQLEVHICFDEAYWGAMIMYATGSGGYNAGLRRLAAEQGYKLNRYGLWASDIRIAGRTEESIYQILGLGFKRPEDRR